MWIATLFGRSNHQLEISSNGEILTRPFSYSTPFTQDINVIDTAFNFLEPEVGKQFVLTGAIISGDRNIGVNGSNLIIYGATTASTTTVTTTMISVEVPKSTILPFVVPNVILPTGEFLNGKCDDNEVLVTVYGYRIPTIHQF